MQSFLSFYNECVFDIQLLKPFISFPVYFFSLIWLLIFTIAFSWQNLLYIVIFICTTFVFLCAWLEGFYLQWIEEPALLVTRFEYANLFHTVTDWYSAYVSSRVTGLPNRPHLIFVDGHCAVCMISFVYLFHLISTF